MKQAFLYKNLAPNYQKPSTNEPKRYRKSKDFVLFFNSPTFSQGPSRNETETNRRESVAGVGDEHASLSDSTVTDCDAFYEPGSTHFALRVTGKSEVRLELFFSLPAIALFDVQTVEKQRQSLVVVKVGHCFVMLC